MSILHRDTLITPSSWDEFKKYLDGRWKTLSLQYEHADGIYTCFCFDQHVMYQYSLYDYDTEKPGVDTEQNNTDVTDLIDNHLSGANRSITTLTGLSDCGGIRNCRMVEERIEFNTAVDVNPTVFAFTTQYKIAPICIKLLAEWDNFNANDRLYAYCLPPNDGVIGTIDQESISDQPSAYATSTVLRSAVPGDYIKIGSEDYKYKIKSRDSEKLVLCEALNETKAASDVVVLYVPRILNEKMIANKIQYFGDKSFGSCFLEVDSKIELHYYHNTNPATEYTIGMSLIHYHGD